MRGIRLGVAIALLVFFGIALFERLAPHRLVRVYWKLVNPLFRLGAGTVPGLVLLETTGRRTGRIHQVPVTARREGGVIWFVAGHARRSAYVHNIKSNPRVRVRMGGRWHEGAATVVNDDDARRRALRVNPANGLFLRMATPDVVSVRVDLDSANHVAEEQTEGGGPHQRKNVQSGLEKGPISGPQCRKS